MRGPGISNDANAAAVWKGPLNDLSLAWRQGDAAPELVGVSTSGLIDFQYDDAGRYLLLTTLAGDGVTEANNEALLLFEPTGVGHLLAREGNTIVIDGVEWLLGTPWGSLAPGDSGLVTMMLGRVDGTGADQYTIVTAQVPEPGWATLLALVGPALLARRRYPAGVMRHSGHRSGLARKS
jgi:hypothetical protein